jgi:hypothetical protein
MKLDLVAELWEVVKTSIISSDKPEVADSVVSMLVDHGCGVDEIREAFRGDYAIIESLKYYSNEEWVEDEQEDEWTLDNDDDDESDDNW